MIHGEGTSPFHLQVQSKARITI